MGLGRMILGSGRTQGGLGGWKWLRSQADDQPCKIGFPLQSVSEKASSKRRLVKYSEMLAEEANDRASRPARHDRKRSESRMVELGQRWTK